MIMNHPVLVRKLRLITIVAAFIVALVGCVHPKEMPTLTNAPSLTAKSVVDNWFEAHKDLIELHVCALIQVTEVHTTVASANKLIDDGTVLYSLPNTNQGTANVIAVMTPNSYNVEIRRGGTPKDAPADLIMNLTTVEGKPIFTESHWYPDLKRYRKATTKHASGEVLERLGAEMTGVMDTQFPMDLFPTLDSCAGAEFLQTWLGAGIKYRIGTMYKAEFLENPQEHAGKMCYVLRRDVYDVMNNDGSGVQHRQKSVDHFFIAKDSFQLVAWTSLRVNVNTETLQAGYQFVERNYAY